MRVSAERGAGMRANVRELNAVTKHGAASAAGPGGGAVRASAGAADEA